MPRARDLPEVAPAATTIKYKSIGSNSGILYLRTDTGLKALPVVDGYIDVPVELQPFMDKHIGVLVERVESN